MNRRLDHLTLAAVFALGTAWPAVAAEAPKSIRIGYAISISGVNAQGASVTTVSGYKLWVDDVNKKGGLMVKEFNKRIPIEVTEYDDTSNAEAAVRLNERLMTQDKVDFVLPPWGTGFNLAVAPVFLLAGVGATLNVLAARLGRIVDRARPMEEQLKRASPDEATVLRRNPEVEQEREIALRDLVHDSSFTPLKAVERGHEGPWKLRLAVSEGRLAIAVRDSSNADAGAIGLGLARFRRVVREYFAICDSYYKATRKASAREIETLDMARRAIHDRGTRQLLEALHGKAVTDFATARRLFTLICVLHIKA